MTTNKNNIDILINKYPDYFNKNSRLATKLIWPLNFIQCVVDYYFNRKRNFPFISYKLLLDRYLINDSIPEETMNDLNNGIDYALNNYLDSRIKFILLDKYKYYKSDADIAEKCGISICRIHQLIMYGLKHVGDITDCSNFIKFGYNYGKMHYDSNHNITNFKTDEQKLDFMLSKFTEYDVGGIRVYNALKKSGRNIVADLYVLDIDTALCTRNFGEKSVHKLSQSVENNYGFIMPKEIYEKFDIHNKPYFDSNNEIGNRIKELENLGFSVLCITSSWMRNHISRIRVKYEKE